MHPLECNTLRGAGKQILRNRIPHGGKAVPCPNSSACSRYPSKGVVREVHIREAGPGSQGPRVSRYWVLWGLWVEDIRATDTLGCISSSSWASRVPKFKGPQAFEGTQGHRSWLLANTSLYLPPPWPKSHPSGYKWDCGHSVCGQ